MSRVVLAGALALVACERDASMDTVAQGDAARSATPETEARAVDPRPEACGRCHAEILAAWRTSMHARAWDDPVFRREYDAAPHASCRDCHAPPTSAPGRTTGIDCATCHLRDGEVLAAELSEAGARAHPLRHEPRLRTSEHCGDCHQFRFRDDGVHDPTEALQDTLAEHRRSDAFARGETCRSCHMRAGPDGLAGHAFPGIHDPLMLASAVDVDVHARRAEGGIDVDVRVRGADIGHAFPTGDVFRSAVLRVHTPSGAASELVMQRWLARTADPDGEDLHVRTVDDTRVPPPGEGELTETLRLEDEGADRVEWSLVLHRLPPGRAAAARLDAGEVTRTVAGGVTPVEGAD